MTISILSVTVRHERRVRLGFSQGLAAGAFGPAAVPLYSVTCLDGTATAPDVTKALAVSASPDFVELQLGADLSQGSLYYFSAVGVPGLDASVTPDPSAVPAMIARETRTAALGARGAPSSFEEALYGRDIRWSGTDFATTPAGDLDTVSGVECVSLDLTARLTEDGLPWDPTWGLNAYEYVDAPSPSLPALRGKAISQMRADDRVATADATVDITDIEAPTITAAPVLVGAALFGAALSLPVPT